MLYRTTMPGVLVETGFLSNSHEEAYLMSAAGQERLSYSIYRAFDEYRRISDGNTTLPVANTAEDSLLKSHPAILKLKQEKLEEAVRSDTFGYRNSSKSEPETRKRFLTLIEKNKSKSQKSKEQQDNTRKAKLVQENVKSVEIKDTVTTFSEPKIRFSSVKTVTKVVPD